MMGCATGGADKDRSALPSASPSGASRGTPSWLASPARPRADEGFPITHILRPKTLRVRLVLAFLAIVLLPLLGTGLYGNWTTSHILQARALDAARGDLQLRAEQIRGYLGSVRESLLFVARVHSLEALLAAGGHPPTALADVRSDFVAFARAHPGVSQVRYIAANGMEVVRVDSNADGIHVVPPDRLQNKSDRYYFVAAMPMRSKEVFVSQVDLNREKGRIDWPLTPTIRFATPVFMRGGARAGVVVLNLRAEPFVRFAHAGHQPGRLLALVDSDGYYLAHPDAARMWGGALDLGTGAGAEKDYGAAWASMRGAPALGDHSGAIVAESSGPWGAVRGELHLLGLLQGGAEAAGRVQVYYAFQCDGPGSPRLILLDDLSCDRLFAPVRTFRLTAVTILALAALASLLMAVVVTRNLTAPILALTGEVRLFGRVHASGWNSDPEQSAASSHPCDEIGELAAAFENMSSALTRHFEQITRLNRAGHRLAACIERSSVLKAAADSIRLLFPAEYWVLSFQADGAPTVHAEGAPQWAIHRDDPSLRAVLAAARADGEWRTASLPGEGGAPAGYMCCARMCVGGHPGLVELYGRSSLLSDPAAGHMLATLSAQVSITLDNADLYERLAQRQAELQVLVERLIDAQEEERRVVAYDIHDGLVQMLCGARLQMSNSLAEFEHAPDRVRNSLQKTSDVLGKAIAEARRVIEGLRPAALDDLGLVATLRQLAEEECAASGADLEFVAEPAALSVQPHVETTAFRIAQEAITNARKYAGSQRLRVGLALADGELRLEIRDWGRGFEESAVAAGRGVGLAGVRERAHLLGGTCHIESAPGAGTVVRATLPIDGSGDAA